MPSPQEWSAEEAVARLTHTDKHVRLEAAGALAALGKRAKPAVPALIEALGDAEAPVRKMAALALGDVGRRARQAVPALIRVLKDGDENVCRRAAIALGEIGDEDGAAEALRAATEDPHPAVRRAALAALHALTDELAQSA
jgi:HEAT repeat protein